MPHPRLGRIITIRDSNADTVLSHDCSSGRSASTGLSVTEVRFNLHNDPLSCNSDEVNGSTGSNAGAYKGVGEWAKATAYRPHFYTSAFENWHYFKKASADVRFYPTRNKASRTPSLLLA